MIVGVSLSLLALVGVVPALLLRPMSDPVPLAICSGGVFGIGIMGMRSVNHSRAAKRTRVARRRFLVARTWSGQRNLDLHQLATVRAKRYLSESGTYTTYVIARDRHGVTVTVGKPADITVIRNAVDQMAAGNPALWPRVSRCARHALGMQPLAWPLPALWSLAAGALLLLNMFGYTYVVIVIGTPDFFSSP